VINDKTGKASCECKFGFSGEKCEQTTCEFLKCPDSQICIDESPPKCVHKSQKKNAKPSENQTNEKLGGNPLVETQGTLETGLVQTPSTVALPWIIVLSVIGSIIVIGLITFIAVLRSKRRATGTYSPTRHEKQPEIIKHNMWKSLESPEPERLI